MICVSARLVCWLPDGTILTAFGTGFTNTETKGESVKLEAVLVKWRLNPL